MTTITIENRQRLYRIARGEMKKLALFLAEKSKVQISEATLIIVDDAGCAPINEAAVGHTGPTDVITLTYAPFPGEPEGITAEIIINAQCAWTQGGGEEGASREFAFYLAHAFDHIAGYDDATPRQRTSMHRREWRWLGEFGETGPLLSGAGPKETGSDAAAPAAPASAACRRRK